MRGAGSVMLAGMVFGAAASLARAESVVELEKLFPKEAEVFLAKPSQAQLVRLRLPAAVLTECRPDLSDLRLFDIEGRETPFLIDSLPTSMALESTQRFAARVIEYFREEVHRESGPPLRRERFVIQAPGRLAATGSWVLVVETDRPEFVCRVQISDSSEERATPMIENGTLFRVRGSQPAEKTRLALPALSANRLRVTLESEDGFWLAPSFHFESAGILERGERIEVLLEVLSREVEDGGSVLELARPRGIVPDLLRLETSTRAFERRIEVRDEGPGIPQQGSAPLASARLFRLKTLALVEDVELPLGQAQGDRLRVRIDDGDSPPLESLTVIAVVRQPSLIFALPASGRTLPGTDTQPRDTGAGGQREDLIAIGKDTPVATLRFGGARAFTPRYDLANFSSAAVGASRGDRGRATSGLYDPSAVAEARLGAIRPNTGFDRAPALGFAMRAGRAVDAGRFSHTRSLSVPGSPEGLVRLLLTPADVAVMREDLSDLRVVNGASEQWPYLLERDASTALIELRIDGPVRKARGSRYTLRPVTPPVRLDRLILQTETGFFDRAIRVTTTREEGGDTEVMSGRLARGRNDHRPLAVAIPPRPYETLTLEVEDGDDAPLTFSSVKGRTLLPAVFLAAPAGTYTLLMGDPDGSAPRYELARVRDVVLAVRSEAVVAGDLLPNPDFSMTSRLASDGRKQQVLLWGALAAAVAILSVLTFRLVRRQTPASG